MKILRTLTNLDYDTEFWVGNTTIRQLRAIAHKYHLIIKTLEQYGSMLRLTVTGNLQKQLHFVLFLQREDIMLVRSS